MFGTVRRLLRLRGPVGALAFAAFAGVLTGVVALHLVLAAWTYRDAARRDLRAPGRWALGVLVGGVFAFGPYVLWRWISDRSGEGNAVETVRRAVRERRSSDADKGRGAGEAAIAADTDAAIADADAEHARGAAADDSLALTTARYGMKAAGMGFRGARWAGRRAVARVLGP